MARLEGAVSAIHDSKAFHAYLDTQARFHRYSWGNVLLIVAQRPDATRVAGFQTWKRLGRHVRKGEHGLKIIVPRGAARVGADEIPPADPLQGEDEGETAPATVPSPASVSTRPRIIGARRFGVGTVFDVSQTEGQPLPSVDVPVLEGDDGLELYGRLERVATDEGVTIERGSERLGPSTMGVYSPDERQIVLRQAATRQMTKTLAHELAHHFGGTTIPSPEEETTAESVAYVVCARFGLDTGQRSFQYVATWSQDPRVFRGALSRIQTLSLRIIERIEGRGAVGPVAERSHDLA